MSWTEQSTISNKFKVKNLKEVKKVLDEMGFYTYVNEDNTVQFFGDSNVYFDENVEVVLSLKPIKVNGEETNFVGICGYTFDIDAEELLENFNEEFSTELTKDDIMVQSIEEYLQDQLIDEKSGISITCAGSDNRCSGAYDNFGDVILITKKTSDFMSLSKWLSDKEQELGITL